ncbi:NUDIX domain-containing protein [Dyadobacter sandarakinus]|uniref:NUDIX domain-containing protein n=1 Tax=Dyadobacter sandarakinus TaxID=2747268 RepID=A0ABX7IBC3_9BACT|nr:NUDIX domain-containing protein [Dyadobacter sandarakinus]QRR02827.1 NUDIX domain-containing protein [Dyadobacter sandarakinus]
MNVRPSALIIKDHAVLTLRYCYGNQEVFALPGGNPDPGECLREALVREIGEEICVEATIGNMVCCGEVIWTEPRKETLHMVFEATITGEPVLDPGQTTALEIVWLPLPEVTGKILYPNVGAQIQSYHTLPYSPFIGPIDQPYVQ